MREVQHYEFRAPPRMLSGDGWLPLLDCDFEQCGGFSAKRHVWAIQLPSKTQDNMTICVIVTALTVPLLLPRRRRCGAIWFRCQYGLLICLLYRQTLLVRDIPELSSEQSVRTAFNPFGQLYEVNDTNWSLSAVVSQNNASSLGYDRCGTYPNDGLPSWNSTTSPVCNKPCARSLQYGGTPGRLYVECQ